MSEDISAEKVAKAVQQLAEAFGVDPKGIEVTVDKPYGLVEVDGGLAVSKVPSVSNDTEDGQTDGQTPMESDDEDDGPSMMDQISWEEMEYNGLKTVASAVRGSEYPDSQSREALVDFCQEAPPKAVKAAVRGDQTPTESDDEDGQTPTESDDENDQTPTESDEEVSVAELLEEGVEPKNVEKVQEYRSKNGVCGVEDCPYGANDDSEYCASHSESKSTTSNDSKSTTSNDSKSTTSNDSNPKASRSYDDLNDAEKSRVNYLISEEGKKIDEAIQMV